MSLDADRRAGRVVGSPAKRAGLIDRRAVSTAFNCQRINPLHRRLTLCKSVRAGANVVIENCADKIGVERKVDECQSGGQPRLDDLVEPNGTL